MKFLTTLFVVGVMATGGAHAAPEENMLESVSVQATGKFTKVVFQSTRALKYKEVKTDNAVSIYLLGPVLSRKPPVEKTYSDLVEEIRYGYKNERTPLPGGKPETLEYVTIRLKGPASSSVVQKDWVLAVELRAGRSDARPDDLAPEEIPPTRANDARPKKNLPASPRLQDFLDVALSNNAMMRIAADEYRLARWRSLEAIRNMLPSVTAKLTESNGVMLQDILISTDDVRFVRREKGFEFGVPLFHSGRNFFAARQAVYQKRAARQAEIKAKSDIVFDVKKAYYNLIKAQRALKVRRELNERAEKIVEVARKKRQLGLLTAADGLGAESLFSQSYYRLLSDEKELEIARLRLTALINTNDSLPALLPEPKWMDRAQDLAQLSVPPESLIQLGMSNRPELLIAEYTAGAQLYGARAATANNLLKVDATYFDGRAGGAFEDGDLSMRRSWNGGIQASLYFLGSTGRGARTQEHTTPDFGETTATDIRGKTASVGLFDSLKNSTDLRQARIARDKAFYERQQARRNVEIDVREAFYNVQKAKIQIKGAQTELDYREKELDISRQKERMNLVEPAQALSAENSYADAVANYEESRSFYQVSLASLERAVGKPLESIPEFR